MPLNIRTMVGIKDKLLEDLTVIAIEQYEGYEESRAVCWGWLLQLMRSTRRNLQIIILKHELKSKPVTLLKETLLARGLR